VLPQSCFQPIGIRSCSSGEPLVNINTFIMRNTNARCWTSRLSVRCRHSTLQQENIVAQTQVWPFEKVNEAISAFREGKPRYRYVVLHVK
jgi:D-arabinose 1-dehydrogenase-like Zn-dependent alcohol dehydrogenase